MNINEISSRFLNSCISPTPPLVFTAVITFISMLEDWNSTCFNGFRIKHPSLYRAGAVIYTRMQTMMASYSTGDIYLLP